MKNYKHIDLRGQLNGQRTRFTRARVSYRCSETLSDIKEELLDGIFFSLNGEYNDKPRHVQLRLVRQLVERRQAKAVHKIVGHTDSRLKASLVNAAYSQSMMSIEQAQHGIAC